MTQRRREVKVLACWVASWAAGLGVFSLAAFPITDESGAVAIVPPILGLMAAVIAWLGIARWWPE